MRSDDPFIPDSRLRALVFVSLFLVLTIVGFTDIRLRSRSIPGRTLNDFTVYWTASRAMAAGDDPYDVSNPRGYRYIYPPFFAVAIRPLTTLPAEWSGVLWYFISVLFAWRCYEELATIVRRVAPPALLPLPIWLAAAPILAVALPGFSCLQGGQTGIVMLWAMLVALRLVVANESPRGAFVAGIFLAVAIAIKLTPSLPAIILIVHEAMRKANESRRRAAAIFAGLLSGACCFLLLVPSMSLGWERNATLLGEFIDRIIVGHLEMRIDQPSNQSPWFALGRTFGDERIGHIGAIILGSVCLILLGGVLLVLRSKRGDLPLATSFGLAAAATVVVAPVAWAHYFVFLAPSILFVPLTFLTSGRRRMAQVTALTPAAVVVAHYGVRMLFPGTAILGIGVALWLIAAEAAVVAKSGPEPGPRPEQTPEPAPGF